MRLGRACNEYGDLVDDEPDEPLAALQAERDALKVELEGDGTHGPDIRKSLGLRAIVELNSEHIALCNIAEGKLTAQLAAAEAARDSLKVEREGRCPTCGLEDRRYYVAKLEHIGRLEAQLAASEAARAALREALEKTRESDEHQQNCRIPECRRCADLQSEKVRLRVAVLGLAPPAGERP